MVREAKPSRPNGRPDEVGQLAIRAALRRTNDQAHRPALAPVMCSAWFAVLFIQENAAIAKILALPFAMPLIHALPAKGHNFFVNLTIARG